MNDQPQPHTPIKIAHPRQVPKRDYPHAVEQYDLVVLRLTDPGPSPAGTGRRGRTRRRAPAGP